MSELKIKTTDDGFLAFDEIMIYELEEIFNKKLIFPWDDSYDEERKVWNGEIDKRPVCIIKCENTIDVQNAIKFGKNYGIRMAIQSTGHHVAGSSIIDYGIVVDLSEMNKIKVDPNEKVATVQPGATWKDLDEITQKYGLATPGGVVSDTGVSGLTLGGGYGWLRRKYGLASDNLISIKMVDGNGNRITASEDENSELFWALQGGSGNFGIVTEFKYKLHHIGNELYMGVTFYEMDRSILKNYLSLCSNLDENITSMALIGWVPEDEAFPERHHNKPTIIILSVYAGDPHQGEDAVKDLHNLGTKYVDFSDIMPYIQIQQFFDEDYPEGMHYYWSSLYFNEIKQNVVDELIEGTLESPSKLTTVDIWHLGGKINEGRESAVQNRDAEFMLGIESNWTIPQNSAKNIEWNNNFKKIMSQYSNKSGYVNFSSGESGEKAAETHYSKYIERMRKIKLEYDPNNLFFSNIPISA